MQGGGGNGRAGAQAAARARTWYIRAIFIIGMRASSGRSLRIPAPYVWKSSVVVTVSFSSSSNIDDSHTEMSTLQISRRPSTNSFGSALDLLPFLVDFGAGAFAAGFAAAFAAAFAGAAFAAGLAGGPGSTFAFFAGGAAAAVALLEARLGPMDVHTQKSRVDVSPTAGHRSPFSVAGPNRVGRNVSSVKVVHYTVLVSTW